MAFTLKNIDTYLITAPDNSTHIGLSVCTSATYTNVKWYYDGELYGHANGYGYSMTGSTMGDWLEQIAQTELCSLVPSNTYYFRAVKPTARHNAKWELESVKRADTHTNGFAKDPAVCGGLTHYHYTATDGTVTLVAKVDGAVGSSSMIELANRCGYSVRWVPCTPNEYNRFTPADFTPTAR